MWWPMLLRGAEAGWEPARALVVAVVCVVLPLVCVALVGRGRQSRVGEAERLDCGSYVDLVAFGDRVSVGRYFELCLSVVDLIRQPFDVCVPGDPVWCRQQLVQ
jgi:hypothetical protein